MSKIAIISDIHANETALEAVLSDAKSLKVSDYVCLGDVVGYGPDPGACLSRVQSLNCITIKGNHDEYAARDCDLVSFNPEAKEAMMWTRSKLSANQREWLGSLPYERRIGRNSLVHATLTNPEEWDYVYRRLDASLQLKKQKVPVCFYGHTHRPMSFMHNENGCVKLEDQIISLDPKAKYLVNVGSVGQSRDKDERACYVIFDRIERTIEFRRVEYDVQSVMERILKAGLPESLAKRLAEAS